MKMKHSVTRCFTGILATIIASYSFCGCGEDSESSAYVSDNATNTVAESTNSLTLETADSSSPEERDAVEPQESAESSSSTLSISSEQGTAESDAEFVEVTTTVTTTAEPVEITTAVTTTEPVEITTTTITSATQPVEVEPETEKAEYSPVTDFEYTITDGEVIINLYMGTDSTVNIPSEIEDCPVVGIERIDGCESVFHPGPWVDDSGMMHNGNSTVTEIIIPDGVKYIGDGAFVRCWALTSIIIPDSVTSIGSSAFYECTQLTSITIPDNVTYIGDHAFDGRVCPSVTYKDQVYDTSENYIAVFNAINNG